ncbi:hypothetical protein Celaphus_00006158, partial [Cervus elaphus hippelaphus]
MTVFSNRRPYFYLSPDPLKHIVGAGIILLVCFNPLTENNHLIQIIMFRSHYHTVYNNIPNLRNCQHVLYQCLSPFNNSNYHLPHDPLQYLHYLLYTARTTAVLCLSYN